MIDTENPMNKRRENYHKKAAIIFQSEPLFEGKNEEEIQDTFKGIYSWYRNNLSENIFPRFIKECLTRINKQSFIPGVINSIKEISDPDWINFYKMRIYVNAINAGKEELQIFQNILKDIIDFIEGMDYNKPMKVETPKVNIPKSDNFLKEFDKEIDFFSVNKKINKKFDVKKLFKSKRLSLKEWIDLKMELEKTSKEWESAGNDNYEAYSFISKGKIKKFSKVIKGWLSFINGQIKRKTIMTSTTLPAVEKVMKLSKVTPKAPKAREDVQEIAKMIDGAKVVYIWNPNRGLLSRLEGGNLTVNGTKVVGFDPAKSKTLWPKKKDEPRTLVDTITKSEKKTEFWNSLGKIREWGLLVTIKGENKVIGVER